MSVTCKVLLFACVLWLLMLDLQLAGLPPLLCKHGHAFTSVLLVDRALPVDTLCDLLLALQAMCILSYISSDTF